jgi:hypothetical protein
MKNQQEYKKDEELKEDILKQREEMKDKTKLEQDLEEPVIGEEKVETKGFNKGNKSVPEGQGGEGQAAAKPAE